MSVPALNPVSAPVIVCPNCKDHIQPEVTPSTRKGPTEIKYFCVNEKSNCTWVLTLSVNHVMGEMLQMKEDEIQKRREQAKTAAEIKATHESKVRRLIMLLPHIEALLAAVQEPEVEVLPPGNGVPEPPAAVDQPPAVEEEPETEEV